LRDKKVGGFTLSDFKTTVNVTVWYQDKNRNASKWNKAESPETELPILWSTDLLLKNFMELYSIKQEFFSSSRV
jgi:hypothetical protein